MQALLSFEKAPPFAAPLRFFLSGPLFAAAAGLLLLVEGEGIFASRWMPGALAATHLITIGFMLQIMLGALIQILPVVAGANLAQPLRVARIVHVGLVAGVLALAGGFLLGRPALLLTAAGVLGTTAASFLAAAGTALFRVPSTSPTIRGLKLALVGLAGVVGLGALLALALANGWSLPLPALTDLHAGWGLGAWAGILLAAIAYIVVPMFQLTPGYPASSGWRFPSLVIALLASWSLALAAGIGWLAQICQLAVALLGASFAAQTLRLQGQRRRARADATYRYWQFGLAAVVLALAMLSTAALRPGIAEAAAWTPVFGILLLVGGFMSFIIGMLYKIVPFLGWTHLQNSGLAKVPAPSMNKLLSDREAERQMLAHAAACLLLVAAALWPAALARPAGLAFAIANAWLFWNLLSAVRRYRWHLRDIEKRLAEKLAEKAAGRA